MIEAPYYSRTTRFKEAFFPWKIKSTLCKQQQQIQ